MVGPRLGRVQHHRPVYSLSGRPPDYTPMIFGERRRDTTWAHQIATVVVFTSPVMVYAANPKGLLESPALEVIKSMPTVWDETPVLPGSSIGQVATFALRSGSNWFLGVLNGSSARTLKVDLSFLGKGSYRATLVRDRGMTVGRWISSTATSRAGTPST